MKKLYFIEVLFILFVFTLIATFISNSGDMFFWLGANNAILENKRVGLVRYYYYLATRLKWFRSMSTYYLTILFFVYFPITLIVFITMYLLNYRFMYNNSSYDDKQQYMFVLLCCIAIFILNYGYYIDFIYSNGKSYDVCDRYKFFTRKEFDHLEATNPKYMHDEYCNDKINDIKNTNAFIWK